MRDEFVASGNEGNYAFCDTAEFNLLIAPYYGHTNVIDSLGSKGAIGKTLQGEGIGQGSKMGPTISKGRD